MNNLPIKRENGIVQKLRMFFYKIFNKSKKKSQTGKDIASSTELAKEGFQDSLQYDLNAINNKKYIIEQIDKYPSILYKLPPERLKGIKILYDEVLEKEKKEIQDLSSKIKNLEAEVFAGYTE